MKRLIPIDQEIAGIPVQLTVLTEEYLVKIIGPHDEVTLDFRTMTFTYEEREADYRLTQKGRESLARETR